MGSGWAMGSESDWETAPATALGWPGPAMVEEAATLPTAMEGGSGYWDHHPLLLHRHRSPPGWARGSRSGMATESGRAMRSVREREWVTLESARDSEAAPAPETPTRAPPLDHPTGRPNERRDDPSVGSAASHPGHSWVAGRPCERSGPGPLSVPRCPPVERSSPRGVRGGSPSVSPTPEFAWPSRAA